MPLPIFHRCGDILDAIDKFLERLEFWPQHVFREHDRRRIEQPSKVRRSKERCDAPSKPGCRNEPAFVLEVFDFFEVAVALQEFRIAFFGPHTRPQLGHHEGDIVIHFVFVTDMPCRCGKACITRKNEG